MEDLIYFTRNHYRVISQNIRDLFDTLNEDFLIFANFTLAEPDVETIPMLLGSALWSRIGKKIRFKEFNKQEAIEYSNELISFYKINVNNVDSPFSEDLIEKILKIITDDLTPRNINKTFRDIIQFSISENNDKITEELISNWIKSQQEY